MGYLPSLPEKTHLADVFSRFPHGAKSLMRFHDVILRGQSPLSIGERELIAAYVSGLNACKFCFNSHTVYAEKFGIDPGLFDALIENIETAPVDERLRPVLKYVRKLTQSPTKVVQADVEAILDAGWDERAVYDAAAVCSIFNCMNRMIFAMGVDPHEETYAQRRANWIGGKSRDQLLRNNQSEIGTTTYSDFGRKIGVVTD